LGGGGRQESCGGGYHYVDEQGPRGSSRGREARVELATSMVARAAVMGRGAEGPVQDC
jgi:hypothetical protein